MGKLGYTSVTLTDLTQTLPVSLTLKSNLNKNIQIKTGTLYEPDFREKISPKEEFEGVIITPSLFLGQEDLEIKKNEIYVNPNFNDETRTSGFIYYEIGNTVYKYNKDITTGIYVDLQGRLHIEENLNENTTIEAYIENFKIETHAYTDPLVSAINPVTILLLEEGSSNYQAMIDCSDGREHFEDTNASPITMTASLWKGKKQIPAEQLLYSWDKLGDGDSIVDEDGPSLTVERKKITNREYFTCIITDTTTGLTYSASQFLYDFTDIYACDISYDKMPLLTDKNTEIILTANVWNKDKLLESGKDGFILSYDWFARGIVSEKEVILIENSTEPTLELNVSGIQELQYQDFVVYCKVYQTDSAGTRYPIAGGTLNIHYTVQYSVKITPQIIFVPTSSSGIRQSANSYDFTFQLLDTEGNPLPRDNSQTTTVGTQNDGTIIDFEGKDGLWDFIGTVDFTNSSLWNEDVSSRIYEFTYVYLGQEFTEEINIVKSYKGEQGFSGYTIDLSNNFHAFSGGEAVADFDQETSFEVFAFYGDKSLEIKDIFLSNDSSKKSLIGNSTDKIPGLTIRGDRGNNNEVIIKIKTGSGEDSLKSGGTLGFNVSIQPEGGGEPISFYKTFSYIINYNGKSYYLSTEPSIIFYSNNLGTYDPEFITINAFERGINGEAINYSQGSILYSYDENNWKYLEEGRIELSSSILIKNIFIRLYSARAGITKDNLQSINLEEKKKYILDNEIIRVSTSLDGIIIGGENLLPRTQDFPLEDAVTETNSELWSRSNIDYINIIKEEDKVFSSVSFNSPSDEEVYSFYSPKIIIDQDYFDTTLCFSCLLYYSDWLNLGDVSFLINGFTKDSLNSCSLEIGKISKNDSSMFFEGEKANGKWLKIFRTFKLDSVTNGDITFKDCLTLQVEFKLRGSGNFKIQKPKLEKGNIATEWSAKPSDILFIELGNLKGESLEKKLKDILSEKDIKEFVKDDIIGELKIDGKSFETVADLQEYLQNEIGKVNVEIGEDGDGEAFKATIKGLLERHGSSIETYESHIIIDFENKEELKKPYIELKTSAENDSSSVKITDEKIDFKVNHDVTTTLSNQYLDTNKIRTKKGIYIGEEDYKNSNGTGYLVIAATEQGVGFKWMDTFIGG